MEIWLSYLWLIPLGFAVGTFGTFIGAGGGFILVPVLALTHRHMEAHLIASISLAVVFFNALSGSVAYARQRKIDYTSGAIFSAATIPGAILGAVSTYFLPQQVFYVLLGLLMIAATAYLLLKSGDSVALSRSPDAHWYTLSRSFSDRKGTSYAYSFNWPLGAGISVLVGYLSSLLGIGGGIIHVPVMNRILRFPIHVATATSHFVLAIMALAGTAVHIYSGTFAAHGLRMTTMLAIGVIGGAPLGAWFSARSKNQWILRALALGLGVIGLRLLILAFE